MAVVETQSSLSPQGKRALIGLFLATILAIGLGIGMLPPAEDIEPPPGNYTELPKSQTNHYFLTFEVNREESTDSIWLRIEDGACYVRLRPETAELVDTDALGRKTRGRTWPIDGKTEHIRIIRKFGRISVFVNNRLAAETFVPIEATGAVALALPDGVTISRSRLQKLDVLPLTDDFMRVEGDESGNWHPNDDWSISSVKDNNSKAKTERSANPFRCLGKSDAQSIRLSRRNFWGGLQLDVPAATLDGGTFGICLLYLAENDHVRLQWNGSKADPPDRIMLIDVSPDGEKVLAEKPAVAHPGQWYNFFAKVFGSTLIAGVDRLARFEIDTQRRPGGKIGLLVAQTKKTLFDDVVARGYDGLAERSYDPESSIFDVPVDLPETGLTCRLAGRGWSDYDLAATLTRVEGKAGLAFGVEGDSGYAFIYDADAGEAQLVGLDMKPLERIKPAKPPTGATRLGVRTDGSYVRCSIDGETVIERYLDAPPTGNVGLIRSGNESFTDITLATREQLEPLSHYSEIFEDNKEMENWANLESSWITRGSRSKPLYWHSADFYGDHSVAVNAPAPTEEQDAGIAICGNGRSVDTAYSLVLRRDEAGKPAAVLLREKTQLATMPVDAAGTVNLKLTKRGSYVIAHVDGKLLAAHHDENPLGDTRLALWAGSREIDLHKIDIRTENIRDFMFESAPTEWVVGGGEWEVTNRWKCDPSWSWFGGGGDSIAVLWTADEYKGDVTAEFFACFQMQSLSGSMSDRYPHPGDINVSICADGRDLSSGYSFIYAGYGGDWTRILRKEKIIAGSNRFAIGNEFWGLHRRWFHIKVRRKGQNVELYIDNELVRAYRDRKEALPGGRIALWSFVNRLMVARVRICSEDIVATPHPLMLAQRNTFETLDPPAPAAGDDVLLKDTFADRSGHFYDRQGIGTVALTQARRGQSDGYLRVSNVLGGGTFSAQVNCGEYSLADYPVIEFDYCIEAGAKVNFYVESGSRLYCIEMNAPTDAALKCERLGSVDSAADDGEWRHARIDLAKLMGARSSRPTLDVDGLFFGSMSTRNYLMCGFGGNRAGSAYGIDNFTITK